MMVVVVEAEVVVVIRSICMTLYREQSKIFLTLVCASYHVGNGRLEFEHQSPAIQLVSFTLVTFLKPVTTHKHYSVM